MSTSAARTKTTGKRSAVRDRRRRVASSRRGEPRIPIHDLIAAVSAYEGLLTAVGLKVDRAALRRRVAEAAGYDGPTKMLFSEAHAKKHPTHTAPECLRRALDQLTADAVRRLRRRLNGASPKGRGRVTAEVLIQAIGKMASDQRQALGEALLKTPHGEIVRRPEISIEQFQGLLREYAQGQTLARKALIKHISKEFRKRGIEMSFDTIEERFRSNTTVKTMPACIVEIMKNLDGRFRTGLVPIEAMCGDSDPKDWLEERRRRYCFKSASAMHQALADATGLRYDSIHKALGSRSPARRIQKDIKDCFDAWEERFRKGEELGVSETYLGVPIEQVQHVLDRLRARYRGNGKLRALLSAELGVSASWAQRYLASKPRVKHMPMRYYRQLVKLAEGPLRPVGESYLKDEQTRELAETICERANQALMMAQRAAQAEEAKVDPEKALERYKKLRLRLIEVLKQRRTAPELASADADDD